MLITLSALTVATVWFEHRTPPREADQSISGAILEYEALSRNLTLQTDAGTRRFLVQDYAPVHQGAKTLTHADLIAASGCRAKVWYRDAQGLWTANEIRISCRNVVPNEVPSSATPER